MLRSLTLVPFGLILMGLPARAQVKDSMPPGHKHMPGMTHPGQDSSFDAMKKRGAQAMKVNQDEATHHFDTLADGGRIELQSDKNDSVAIAGIRDHFKDIERAFRAGDFSIPMFVHNEEVPGTKVMAAKKDRITYTRRDLPRGAELRMRTTDREAIKAIHDFMAYQRQEHHATGMK
jgi:hypothetical protein